MNTNDKNIITDDLLARFFASDTSQAENNLILDWKNSNVENQKYFSDLKIIWENSASINKDNFDAEMAWKSVQSRIQKIPNQNKIIELKSSQLNHNLLLRIAASIVVVVGFALAYYVIIGKEESEKFSEIKITTHQDTRNDTLPDGSIIALNKNSTVTYNTGFGKSNRKIILNGEAFFQVKHKAGNNFIVVANELEIRDIGTAFNIKTKKGGETEVIVSEGSVMVTAERDSMLVVKGNKVRYNKAQKKMIKETNNDINFDAYRTKTLVFERAEMYKVIEILNDIYNTKIEIDNENFRGCKLTATFNNESLDSILEIIQDTFLIKINKTDTGFNLEGNGC